MKVEVVGLQNVLITLDPGEHKKIYNSTLKRLANRARTIARKTIALEYGLPFESTKGIAVRANKSVGSVTLWGSSRRFNLVADLNAKDIRPRGVEYKAIKGNTVILSHAFIRNMYGRDQVYERIYNTDVSGMPHGFPVKRLEKELGIPRHDEALTQGDAPRAVQEYFNTEGKAQFEKALIAFANRKIKSIIKKGTS
jgi:hypothetical protein